MKEFLQSEKDRLIEHYLKLKKISNKTASVKPEEKWSIKEIIGHLIDSASNNHYRFVAAQFTDDLLFMGYDQDAWVEAQNYQSEDWKLLIELFYKLNLHLINLIENIPEQILTQKRNLHNLFEIAWQEFDVSETADLEWFVRDYFGHLNHHLSQVFLKLKNIKGN